MRLNKVFEPARLKGTVMLHSMLKTDYRVFHNEMRETKALDGHLKLNFHP